MESERVVPETGDVAVLERLVADTFAGLAGSGAYPCLGARSVVHREAFSIRVYEQFGSPCAAEQLAADLANFGTHVESGELRSFAAVFAEPAALTEERFHQLLWAQLQMLHGADRSRYPWDARVSADPDDAHFSFSVGGAAYFVIGLHAGSSRWARRFAWPTLVFNPHQQFVAMREAGKYERVRAMIRGRDTDLQGSANPVLRDHGDLSEARQYAGDAVASDWRCPLVVEPRP
jgi:FPC/CPF motif-containing protein YcgG